ncbi:STAS domain-containing protein [Streptomyces sodiiphilus]|uniref:Anti-sigma factor antagonist n=1 Tax=Streptomyces sodiiphilus TaxID=226217 RepID=A0ABN2PM30_9ACTN
MHPGTPDSAGRRQLSVETRRLETCDVIRLKGELDHHSADELRGPLEGCVAEGCRRIVLDCAALEFCDSTGLNLLLSARMDAEAAGGTIHLAGLNAAVARVFQITGADAVFPLHETVDAALAELPAE